MRDLHVDPERQLAEGYSITNVFVRALFPDGKWGNADIYELDKESLDAWLRSRDSIEWPIGVVMYLLEHV